MVNNSELCQEAADIHRSKSYISVMGLVVILNFTGLLLLINSTVFLVKTKKISLNLRFLLLSLTIAFAARDVLTAIRALYRIYLVIFISDNCGFTATNSFCVIESAITAVPFNVALYSFPVISIERLFATVFRKIEEMKVFTYLVFVSVVAAWLAVTYNKVETVWTTKSPDKLQAYCSSVMKIDEINYFNYFVNVQFIFPFIASIIGIGIYKFCKNKKDRFFKTHTASHSLTERYNLSEIIRTSFIVLMLCSIFYIMYVFYQLALLLTVLQFEINTLRSFSVVKEICSLCFTSVYANIYGYIFLAFQRKDIKNSKLPTVFIPGCSSAQRTPNSVSPTRSQSNTYFKFYEKLWK